ncbi:(+)-neomenthol dehydrogenase [Carica papaya]|uniref:(+)-neomenthol dehydrogenase n=1 Tax=Carica papaya TaxID=3649 RepID=UPI000B8D008E|nr:(+)-neomenthol dehydrogenase [Carica papaya]
MHQPKEPDYSSPPQLPTRWWSREMTAVVTGANKGIGFALVRRLAEMGLTVILTARDDGRGRKALESLKQEGFHHRLHFYCLDVSNPTSINAFVSWFTANFAALDILINNAAVSFNDIEENTVDHAETVMKINFYGAKLLTQALLPFFRRSPSVSRILNITSRLGSINKVRNPRIKQVLRDENLKEEHIDGIVQLFLENVKDGTWRSQGWPEIWTEYAVSKLALNAYTWVLAKREEGRRLSVNCFCPGFTQTAMTGGRGTHSAQDAAEVAASLVLLPPEKLPSGKFYMGFGPFNNINCTYSKL